MAVCTNINSTITYINTHTSAEKLAKVKFQVAFILPYGVVMQAESLHDIYQKLRESSEHSRIAIALLKHMLEKAGVKHQVVLELDPYVGGATLGSEMEFSDVMMYIIQELGDKNLRFLKHHYEPGEIGKARDDVTSAVDLFQGLIHSKAIDKSKPDTLRRLMENLHQVGRADVADKVKEFLESVARRQPQDGSDTSSDGVTETRQDYQGGSAAGSVGVTEERNYRGNPRRSPPMLSNHLQLTASEMVSTSEGTEKSPLIGKEVHTERDLPICSTGIRRHVTCSKIACISSFLLQLLLLSAAVPVFVVFYTSTPHPNDVLLNPNTTVQACVDIDSFHYDRLGLTIVDAPGGYSYCLKVCVLECRDTNPRIQRIIYAENGSTKNETRFFAKFGKDIWYWYMLPHSSITYTIHLYQYENETTLPQANLLVFDDYTICDCYQKGDDSAAKDAVYTWTSSSSDNTTEYHVEHAAYYCAVWNLPQNVTFDYRTDGVLEYYDIHDYNSSECRDFNTDQHHINIDLRLGSAKVPRHHNSLCVLVYQQSNPFAPYPVRLQCALHRIFFNIDIIFALLLFVIFLIICILCIIIIGYHCVPKSSQ